MYSNPVSISNGTATVAFDLRGSSLEVSEYKDATAALDLEHTFTVKHAVTNKGKPTQARRSVYRFDRTVETDEGVQGDTEVYLVVVTPQKVATSTQMTEQVTLMKSFLSVSGNIAKIVNADL